MLHLGVTWGRWLSYGFYEVDDCHDIYDYEAMPWTQQPLYRKHLIGSIFTMTGNISGCRPTWCWRGSRQLYLWSADSRKRAPQWAWLEHLRSQSPPPVTPFTQQRSYLLIVLLPMSLWGHFIQTTKWQFKKKNGNQVVVHPEKLRNLPIS